MSTYPHRYGDTDRARQHYATACVASAKVLRNEGFPEQAADLETEARHAQRVDRGRGKRGRGRARGGVGPPRRLARSLARPQGAL